MSTIPSAGEKKETLENETQMRIKSALVAVFNKQGIDPIVKKLHDLGIEIYSTGGTHDHIKGLDIPVRSVEGLTSFPSIFGGRVKTLHPKVFGGILARRGVEVDTDQLSDYHIPEIDLVIVDLYPFEETIRDGGTEEEIIEKIDIGGVSLIRAAAKNFKDVLVVPSRYHYAPFMELLDQKKGKTDLEDRKAFARKAFHITAHYDTIIANYFDPDKEEFHQSLKPKKELRYGENPHQKGAFYGDLDTLFEKLNGKELSYNNLLDVSAAVSLMKEFKDDSPTFAVIKHNNACGLATRDNTVEAWKKALEGDPVSAFGGIIISNTSIDKETAEEIGDLFFEVLIAPGYDEDALEILRQKKKRIVLKLKAFPEEEVSYRSTLNGVLAQDADNRTETRADLSTSTKKEPSEKEVDDLLFANKIAKHTRSNTIVLAKDHQLLGSGTGETSRVDALKHAIQKANAFELDLKGAVMASDAFFPFPDCVDIGNEAGISAVIQPGGSIRDQESIDHCDQHGMAMVMTGHRHFKH